MNCKPSVEEKKYLSVKHIVDALVKDDVQIINEPGVTNSTANFSLKKFLCRAMCEGVSALNWKMIDQLVEKLDLSNAVSFEKEFGLGVAQSPGNGYDSLWNYGYGDLRKF